MPSPNHTTSSGAIAIFGITWANSTIGYSALSRVREYAIATAVSRPSSTATTKPTTVSYSVTSV